MRMFCAAVLAVVLLAGGPVAAAQPDQEALIYAHAEGITFEPVELGVWKVIDPTTPVSADPELPEWHQGVAVGPDGVVWVWGPGGLRELGGAPIADDVEMGYTKSGLIDVGVDGTLWAEIDSELRSFDGQAWTTRGPEHVTATPGDPSYHYAMLVEVLPDDTVWAAWHIGDSWHVGDRTVVASFDGLEWTEHDAFEDVDILNGIAGTPDGDVWVGVGSAGPTGLMRLQEDTWAPVEQPWAAAYPFEVASDPEGTLWTTVEREGQSGCTDLARLADGSWSVHTPAGEAETCATALLGFEVAPDGSVWIPSVFGVDAFDGNIWERHLHGDVTLLDVSRSANDLDIAPDGTVWVAAAGGLFVIRP